MICPNDNALMHQSAVPSHYGKKVIVDQCGGCGGVWFDAFELYKIKQGAENIIEEVDADILRAATEFENKTLKCPRDQTVLFQFDDPRFPKSIVLMRCPTCQGFWLNRGEFTKYQQARQNLKPSKEKSIEDQKLNDEVKQLLASRLANNSSDVLGKAGAFLSAPVGVQTFLSPNSSQGLTEKESNFESILNVLVLILQLLIFR